MTKPMVQSPGNGSDKDSKKYLKKLHKSAEIVCYRYLVRACAIRLRNDLTKYKYCYCGYEYCNICRYNSVQKYWQSLHS
jgi:hypothetical protein